MRSRDRIGRDPLSSWLLTSEETKRDSPLNGTVKTEVPPSKGLNIMQLFNGSSERKVLKQK